MGTDPKTEGGDIHAGDIESFLLGLSDALRPLGDPLAVQHVAAEMLGQRLGVSRAFYFTVRRDPGGYVHVIERDYFRASHLASLIGDHPISAYGTDFLEQLTLGAPSVVGDIRAVPEMTTALLANYETIETRAWLTVPLLKDGVYIAGLAMLHDSPREWTPADVELVKAVAERTWAAVERARAEAALRESQQLLSTVFDLLPVGVMVVNMDGHAVLANKALSRYMPTGVIPSCDSVRVGRWLAWDTAGKAVDRNRFPGARALRGDSVVPGLDMLYTPDEGAAMWTNVSTVPFRDAQGRIIGHIGVINDIDAAKRNAEALARSERRFQEFAQASSCGLWMRNATTLQLEYVSPAIATIYGVAPDELLGDMQKWVSMIVPEDRAAALQHFERARRGEASSLVFRIRRANDRSFRWIHGQAFPMRDGRGDLYAIGGISEDVTETAIAQEHQGVLLAELQHRVRNILAIVRGITVRTGHVAASGENVAQTIAARLDALARVQLMLTQESGVDVRIATIVREEIGAQAPEFRGADLSGPEIALSPKAAESLTLAVHELATNAVKYGALADPPGRVVVRWSTEERLGATWFVFDWVEKSARQVTPRAAGSSRRRGFGTELIEQRIPYELGGKGRLDVGADNAHCHLEFPLEAHASVLESSIPGLASVSGGSLDVQGAPSLQGKTVIVIEDEYYVARDMAAALMSAGAKVAGPCSSEEMAWAELLSRRPDAAVVDINLGHGPAFKLADYLRNRDIPFVFVTGYNRTEQPEGFVDVPWLRKPVNFRQLISSIAQLFE